MVSTLFVPPSLLQSQSADRNKWDTANIYSNGDSERVIAQAIKKYNIPRHKLVLMTKSWSCCGEQQFHAYPILDDLRKTKDYVNQFGRFKYPKKKLGVQC